MLQPERYSQEEIKDIMSACCHVFMTEKVLNSVVDPGYHGQRIRYPFLEKLTYEDVKRAYRSNIFTYHPDRHQDKGPEDIDFYTRHVTMVNHSYEYLTTLFNKRKAEVLPEIGRPKRVIAVGGAKGGIGKSIFAANLGMMLCSLGYRTLMVDLDLGGSDLHIYLGHRRIPGVTLNDFLNRKVASLNDTIIECEHGPMLIAGDLGELGAANIPFQRKMRLIEKIREANADYIILDLGGGTDFNTLDFFLASDIGIVLATLDQSAYIEAYAFIKTALQRKLNRLFGADSPFPERRNALLKGIVADGTSASGNDGPSTISALLERIAAEDPVSLPLISDEILRFCPFLVINHSFNHGAASKIASTIQSIAGQRLSIHVNHIGTISKHRSIEQSTSYAQHPILKWHKSGLFASEMESIINASGIVSTRT
ncbi:MAG TPA: AAA family ATPase [Syntrophorhabdaceae bacterium]|nr:AAA family ATPase [Syntrophorhabdaceae bacterium]